LPLLFSLFLLTTPRPPISTLFPYTTLFRSSPFTRWAAGVYLDQQMRKDSLPDATSQMSFESRRYNTYDFWVGHSFPLFNGASERSEEHTSELQSRENIVCRLLLEKKTVCDF